MNIIARKNNLLFFTAIIFVLLVYMGFSVFNKNRSATTSIEKEVTEIQTQSESTEIDSIEKDLMETDLKNLDRELSDIEKELNSAY